MTRLSSGVTFGIGKGLRNIWRRYDDIQFLGEDTRLTLAQPVKYFDDYNLYSSELQKVGSDQGLLPIEHAELLPEMAPFRDALTKPSWAKPKLTEDIYPGTIAGLVHCMNSIHKGFRSSSYVFVEGKPNITILSSTHSKKLLFDGTTVTGLEAIGPDGQELTFCANYEVIVSPGVFESPKLLMLSGVGPEEILKERNIEPVLKSAHVGKNLLDHPIVPHAFRLKDGLGLDDHLLRAGPAMAVL
jgi:choline dehydrogenase